MAENESLDTSEYTRYFALPASEATLALRRAFGVDTVLHLAHVRYLNPNSVTSIGLAQPQQPQEASSSVPTSHRSRPTANSPPPLASGSPATTPQPRILDSPALLDDASRALCQQFIASSSPHDSPAQSVRFHCDHPRQADSSQLLTEPFAPEEPATLPADTPSVTRYSPSESSDDDESARGSRAAGRTLNICHADREFVVKKTIGHCAYGLVWHADMANLHSGQKREVAIKALHKTTMLVARTRSRGQGQDQRDAIVDANLALERNMRNELHVLKKVTRSRSPFLSPLLYAFSKEKYFYFVMRKYLTDLRTLTHVNKHVSTKQKRTWAAEIVSGLDDLHSLGIVHRDIKPENIFISPSGHAVISDFGHAAYAGDDRGVEDLQMNAASGTPGFMAPEQIPQRCSGGYTFKVDMWAFGVTLMEIVLGDVSHLSLFLSMRSIC
ncbi:kinase-like protein [Coniophora puteana RWD-64-598 SS2]|uniref:Kinase-like protein n=1 Tax=Coniophora puteana (strain RWD-64-598) TaxID=741705 RepID=A0A5M3N2S5_CONPW|nr:kinase-like protein [Coniophora puteana RWD-64-598 SS2]EIW85692.1 kinase-like protein [Coniophora puteana RWD-64-598 SS2]